MDAHVIEKDRSAVIELSGRFDFNAHRAFRGAMDRALGMDVEGVRIDMERVPYLDSSALGMLLMLRDKALGRNWSVELCGAEGNVRQVLDIANFDRLFAIS